MTPHKRTTVAAEKDQKRRTEELTGVFNSIRWQNEEGTFLIATLMSGQTVKGNARPGSFIQGVEYVFGGRWESNPRYGDAFIFQTYKSLEPVTADAVRGYLQRHLCGANCGIGMVGVSRLILEFGPDKVLSTIKGKPDVVANLLKLKPEQAKEAQKILLSVEKFENTRLQLNQLFEGRGFPQTTIEACIETFGVNAAEAIRRDPFTMLVRDFPGCGFLRVNALYESLNLPAGRLKRQVICMWHMMHEGNGSVWYDAEWIAQELSRLVSSDVKFRKSLQLGIRAKWLSRRKDAEGKLWLAAREHAAVENDLVSLVSERLKGVQLCPGEMSPCPSH